MLTALATDLRSVIAQALSYMTTTHDTAGNKHASVSLHIMLRITQACTRIWALQSIHFESKCKLRIAVVHNVNYKATAMVCTIKGARARFI